MLKTGLTIRATGYLLALELSNDQNHRATLKHWRSMREALPPLVTTSYVFDEVVTYVQMTSTVLSSNNASGKKSEFKQ